MSRPTLPTSTMRATSRVSASVTRKPSTNAVSLPSRVKLADLRTAAVHHDGFQADGAKQDDVLCKRLRQRRVHHGVPTDHDDDGVAETLDRAGPRRARGRPSGETPVGEVVGHERHRIDVDVAVGEIAGPIVASPSPMPTSTRISTSGVRRCSVARSSE